MIIKAKPVRSIDYDTFTDITTAMILAVWWSGDELSVEFATDLTAGQQAAVLRRMTSRNANEEELRRRGDVALQANRDYLVNAATATNAAVRDQVAALTRQNNGILRMALDLLDGTD